MHLDEGNIFTKEEIEILMAVFFDQSNVLLETANKSLLQLEEDAEDKEAMRQLLRALHTLKGDANSVGFTEIGTLAHRLEDILSFVRNANLPLERATLDLLLSGLDTITDTLQQRAASPEEEVDITPLLTRLEIFTQSHCPDAKTNSASKTKFILTKEQIKEIANAIHNGKHALELKIFFDEDCLMRGAGALILKRELEHWAELITIAPDIDNDEALNNTKYISVILITYEAKEVHTTALVAGITSHATATPLLAVGEEIKLSETILVESIETKLPLSLPVNRPNGNGTTVQDSPIIETAHSPKTTPAIELLRIDATKVDRLMDLVGELIISRSMLSEIQTQLKREFPKHTQVSRLSDIDSYLGRILAEMQKAVMQVRMVSLDQIFNRFFRVVRDLAHDRNKQIQLETVGEETELDKRVVDTIYEPLLHLVRNAVDHGIEDEQTRQAAGKPVRGHILLKAYYQGDQVVIEVEDDGCGIDIERLKAKAVERKLISPYEINTLQGQSALELIFLSGLSTAERVSEVSGRGVGMDVVKNVLDSLKGSIEINSEIGRGTRFTLRLPLTLAIIRTMLFKIEDRVLALPLANVIEIVRAPHQQLQQIGNHKVYNLRDTFYSLIELDKLLLQRSSRKSIDNPFILLVGMGERRMGLIADSVIGEQEIVVKAVDKNWISSDLVTGASILGDGQIVLILDTNALLRRVTTLTRSATAER